MLGVETEGNKYEPYGAYPAFHPPFAYTLERLRMGIADMMLLPDLSTFSPDTVISCGKVVSKNGRMTVSPCHHAFLPESKQTIRLSATFSAADFKISAPSAQPETNARVIELQGGAVLCAEGKIVLELALPIFGLITQAPMAEIAAKVKGINEKANGLGVPFPDALLSLITLTSAVIPYLKICEEGLVSLKDGMGKSLFPDSFSSVSPW